MLHEQAVDKRLLSLVKKMSQDSYFNQFVLVGGTALALQLGHRKSKDIDLFTNRPFESSLMSNYLLSKYKADKTHNNVNMVTAMVDGVKIDILSHRYKWLQPFVKEDGIQMASLDDIAAMKLHAVVNNGQRVKDFFDLHKLLEHRSLNDIMKSYLEKYPGMDTEVAKMSLKYHAEIDFSDHVKPIGKAPKWNEIDARIDTALREPDKKFNTTENHVQQQQTKNRHKRMD